MKSNHNNIDKARLTGKKILVVGLGKTGWSVVEFLQANDLEFQVVDTMIAAAELSLIQQRLRGAALHQELNEKLVLSFDVLVCSPGVPLALPALQTAAREGREIVGDVELFARLVDVPVIAVTGSNGKSTVVAWIEEILRKSELTAIACGNIGEPVLGVLEKSVQLYVLELSSFQLETLSSLQPLAATVLNVSEDHLDRYDGIEHYARIKRGIYSGCQQIVCNADDERTWLQPDATEPGSSVSDKMEPDTPVLYFGSDGTVSSIPVAYSLRERDGQVWLHCENEPLIAQSELPLPGKHNAENALAILALLSPLAIPTETLIEGLKRFKGLPHRTQLVSNIDGVRWYNDSKGTNVDACSRAVGAMASPVVLIAGGLGKGADFTLLRKPVAEHVKALVLIGKDAVLLEEALTDLVAVHHAVDMRSAVAKASRIAESGDVVLLSPACSSFDMFDSFEHRGDEFAREVMELAA